MTVDVSGAARAARLVLALLAVSAVLASCPRGRGEAVADDAAVAAEETRLAPLVIDTTQGPATFRVELAATPAMLTQGLMYRQRLPADQGMLFDFGPERIVTMWMKNTFIPLDMLFIDADGTVADIAEETEPLSLETIASRVPVRAVLEINAGTVVALGIREGDRVHHPIFAATSRK